MAGINAIAVVTAAAALIEGLSLPRARDGGDG